MATAMSPPERASGPLRQPTSRAAMVRGQRDTHAEGGCVAAPTEPARPGRGLPARKAGEGASELWQCTLPRARGQPQHNKGRRRQLGSMWEEEEGG